MGSPVETIKQLHAARLIVLGDASIYAKVVPGVLPVIGAAAHIDLRRWGADFLAETFASPVVMAPLKQTLSLLVLETLVGYLNRKDEFGEEEDPNVVKSAIQCAASLYAYVFRHTIDTPTDQETWAKMAKIKSHILRRMDTAIAGVRICCIKFVARVVQVQTPGIIADPRRPEQNEISLALVPRDHAIIPPSNLEAEASGLLDRLLGVLQDNLSDALIVTATLNALSALVHRRPSVSQKIISIVLNFDPLTLANGPMSGRDKVAIRSMTRTTMSFLYNVIKRNQTLPTAGRLQMAAERLRQRLDEAFSDRIKRSAPDESPEAPDESKRRRVEPSTINGVPAGVMLSASAPPIPPGPVSYAQLYTLSQDPAAVSFHVEAIPADIVTKLLMGLMPHIDGTRLNDAINIVRKRYLDLPRTSPVVPIMEPPTQVNEEDEDDDYDPSANFSSAEQAMTAPQQNQMPTHMALPALVQDVEIGPFILPPSRPLTAVQLEAHGRATVVRLFERLAELENEARTKSSKDPEMERGFNSTAPSPFTRRGWLTLLIRTATRTLVVHPPNEDASHGKSELALAKRNQPFNIPNAIRQGLMRYILEDFRRRIGVAISWLNEEWYSEMLEKNAHEGNITNGSDLSDGLHNYWHYSIRILDAITPYIDTKDAKMVIRFLSEIPQLNNAIIDRIQALANDPEKVSVTTTALLYLSIYRPPVREMVVDAAERLWMENSDAKAGAEKILTRWRPEVLKTAPNAVKTEA